MASRIGSHYYLRAIDSKARFSNLSMELDNGECRTYGRPLMTIFSNSRFGNGSGTALTNDAVFEYKIPKTLSSVVNFYKLGLAKDTVSYADVCGSAGQVKAVLEENIGKVIQVRYIIGVVGFISNRVWYQVWVSYSQKPKMLLSNTYGLFLSFELPPLYFFPDSYIQEDRVL